MKKLVSVLLTCCMAVSLTACGGANEGGKTNGSGQTTASANEQEGDSSENGKKVLKIGMNMAPQNISPFTHFSNRQPVQDYLYEPLAKKDMDGVYRGIIAKQWTTEDNVTYEFEIYDYVKDTAGNPIKAEDCVFSLEHARSEASNTWIKSAEVTGEYTFTLTLSDDSVSTFPTAIDRAPIVSKASYEASSDSMATTSISSAPYMVVDYIPNVSISFEKNPDYWQTDESLQNPLYKNATVDRMDYIKISEAAQQTIALETGSIDAYYQIANSEVANFLAGGRNEAGFDSFGYVTATSYILYFANQGISQEDINFRMAVSHGVDKASIVQGAFDGLAVMPTFMGAPDGMSDLAPASAGDDYFTYNPELAKEYLEKSGYKGEKLRLLVPNEDNHNRIAAIVQGQLMAIGINVEIQAFDNAMFQSNFADGSSWDISICQMGMGDVALVWNFLSWKLSGGDTGASGMALKDDKLDGLLSVVNTIEGHTDENATAASDYINEMAYGQNLLCTTYYYIFRKDLGVKEVPILARGGLPIMGCAVFE